MSFGEELSVRAWVILASRCALRTRLLFRGDWPDAPEQHVAAVDAACELADAVARQFLAERWAFAWPALDAERADEATGRVGAATAAKRAAETRGALLAARAASIAERAALAVFASARGSDSIAAAAGRFAAEDEARLASEWCRDGRRPPSAYDRALLQQASDARVLPVGFEEILHAEDERLRIVWDRGRGAQDPGTRE